MFAHADTSIKCLGKFTMNMKMTYRESFCNGTYEINFDV